LFIFMYHLWTKNETLHYIIRFIFALLVNVRLDVRFWNVFTHAYWTVHVYLTIKVIFITSLALSNKRTYKHVQSLTDNRTRHVKEHYHITIIFTSRCCFHLLYLLWVWKKYNFSKFDFLEYFILEETSQANKLKIRFPFHFLVLN
jgi:hypothetical protein